MELLIFPKQHQEPFSGRMEAPIQLLGIQPNLGLGPQPGAKGHSLGEWRHLVSYQEINPVSG